MLIKGATHNLIVRTRAEVALYVLNHKRAHLRALEERFRISITVSADPAVTGQQSYVIDRGEQVHTPEAARSLAAQHPQLAPVAEMEDETVEVDEHFEESEFPAEAEQRVEGSEREAGRRRRRRRGRGGRGRGGEPREHAQNAQNFTNDTVPEHAVTHEDHDGGSPDEDGGFGQPQPRQEGASGERETREGRRRRRRGRRGGRRNRQRNGEAPFRSGENGPEPGLHHAAEEFESPLSYDSPQNFSQPVEEQPPAPPPEPQAPVFSVQESPRRRSTIREPAPFASDTPPAPSPASPPAPVISSSGTEEAAAPKRGWWGKRLLGDKG